MSSYIHIDERELADDYPLPTYYRPSSKEKDEDIFLFVKNKYIAFEEKVPLRALEDWALYNCDCRLVPLELLPLCEAEQDLSIFGSGKVSPINGSPSDCSSSSDEDFSAVFLTPVKQWKFDISYSHWKELKRLNFFSESSIWFRTHRAWYRLGKPSQQYSRWYEQVVKAVKVAIAIDKILQRRCQLSFFDVVGIVAEFKEDFPAYVSSNLDAVERYITVHGQILLHIFPDNNCRHSFVSVLLQKMEEKYHSKLDVKTMILSSGLNNLNPSAALAPVQFKQKAMRATTTRLINRIWREFYSSHYEGEDTNKGDEHEKEEEEEEEIVEEENEEDENGELATLLIQEIKSVEPPILTSETCKLDSAIKEISWDGESKSTMSTGEKVYGGVVIGEIRFSAGSSVVAEINSGSKGQRMIYIEYLFEKSDQGKMAHGRVLQRGCQTVLGNASDEHEVFMTNECLDFDVVAVQQKVIVEIISSKDRGKKFIEAKEGDVKARDLPVKYFCKSLYWPERGAFFDLPLEKMGLGTGICGSCILKEAQKNEQCVHLSEANFAYRNVEYSLLDFVYVAPSHFFEKTEGVIRNNGSNDLHSYVVCQLLKIEVTPQGSQTVKPESATVELRRFFRPEDISADKAYMSDIREVYYSEEIFTLSGGVLEGKCVVRRKREVPYLNGLSAFDHIFFCEYSYDSNDESIKPLPGNFRLRNSAVRMIHGVSSRKRKGKSKVGEPVDDHSEKDSSLLDTLVIFAGCGGLSEGLRHCGVSKIKWAIEDDEHAAATFLLNHQLKRVFFKDNISVILRATIEKFGEKDDCLSTSETAEQAACLGEEKINDLPAPNKVDFIVGSPPSQGFSGKNRISNSTWSMVQCESILAFLSFTDFLRPKFFLMECVRNFLSFIKGQPFRLTLASLLAMGYQVRFGILDSGAFGVSQSCKRTFIWAAASGEILPDWPEPMYVSGSRELKIALPGDVHYAAVRNTAGGAPFRSITVKDTIRDLPSVENGASDLSISYTASPVSWFQKQIRGEEFTLKDHITKEMDELNHSRCQQIPKGLCADWHVLPYMKVLLSSGLIADFRPWHLPNTAERNNQWRGFFGRLDWWGNFPNIADPEPSGKVGTCFHPTQDRIVTVRECARSKGFRDGYVFSGDIKTKYRQIANSVPPPLAFALGRKLLGALKQEHSAS